MQYTDYIKHIGSRSVLVLIGLLAFLQFTRLSTFQKEEAIRHDMKAYYGYLPAAIIHGDLTLKSIPQAEEKWYDWTVEAENGRIFRMTMGVALFNAPAFIIADSFARLGNGPRTGHDSRYYFFVFLTAMVCFIKGLQWVYTLCRRYAGILVSIIVTLCIGFGTNLTYYAFDEPMMSHVYSFFLYALLLKSSLEWADEQKWLSVLGIGFSIGMLTLIRPIHVLSAMIPVMLILIRGIKFWKQFPQILVAMLLAFLCFLPQMIYWKYLSGSWLFYSYGDEGFFFQSPMIWNGLFGFRKGWFIYTPLALLILPGFVFMLRRQKSYFFTSLSFLIVYVYVVFSWWCWWYGGSFGSRPMIDVLALCAPLMAIAVERMRMLGRAPIMFPLAIAFAVIYLNRFQTQQYRSTMLHWDSMNRELYEAIWLEKKFPENYDELLSPPDYESAKKGLRKPE